MKQKPAGDEAQEFRIEELAELAKTTVRNIRVYQEKGLLSPPTRRGRTAWYNAEHLTRLHRITHLLDRGYTFATISELFTAERSGLSVTELIEAESARALRRSRGRKSRTMLTNFEDRMGVTFSAEVVTVGRATGTAVVSESGEIEFMDDAVQEMIRYLAALGLDSEGFEKIAVSSVEALEEMLASFIPVVELIITNAAEESPYTRTRAEFDDASALAATVVRKLYLQLIRTAFEARLERGPAEPEQDNG